MKNNNGKVAIAIVAMFVVALSIVGLTYAYFTARVVGNDANQSIQVTAGELVISYNNSQSIAALNIVPGWISDGKTFYDPVYSIQNFNGVRGITAVSTDDFGADATDATKPATGKLAIKPSIVPDTTTNVVIDADENITKEYSAYGLADPATFNVVNEGTDGAAYEVELSFDIDGIADLENLVAYLYESDSETFGTTPIFTTTFKDKTSPITAITTRTLATTGAKKYYKLVLEYKEAAEAGNDTADNQDASQDAKVLVTVNVNGLPQTSVGQNNPAVQPAVQ